jgi:cytidylate kinase
MHSTEQLIARHIAFFEARERAAQESGGRGKIKGVTYGPYLLLSREKGSGGTTVSRLIGERLNWPIFDREIVDEIANRTQARRQLIESLDERTRTLAQELLAPALDRHDIGKTGYLMHLRQVVLALGHQGHVVIVGRGARHILPREFGLSVRLVAPFETRLRRLADAENLSPQAARTALQKSDNERETFIQRNFNHAAGDLFSHDLVINTEQLTPQAVAEIVLAALHHKLGV